jgi:hypothetical protein
MLRMLALNCTPQPRLTDRKHVKVHMQQLVLTHTDRLCVHSYHMCSAMSRTCLQYNYGMLAQQEASSNLLLSRALLQTCPQQINLHYLRLLSEGEQCFMDTTYTKSYWSCPGRAVFARDEPEDATVVVARYLLYILCCTVTKLPFLFCPSSLTAASLSFLRSIMRKSPIIII